MVQDVGAVQRDELEIVIRGGGRVATLDDAQTEFNREDHGGFEDQLTVLYESDGTYDRDGLEDESTVELDSGLDFLLGGLELKPTVPLLFNPGDLKRLRDDQLEIYTAALYRQYQDSNHLLRLIAQTRQEREDRQR